MLEILLVPEDGGTAWRHLLASGEARAGWECVGPLGLSRRLGRVLGVPSDPAPAADRLAAWAARVDRHDDGHRAYSRSRETDAFGVAAHLLALRDRLRIAGWRGGPLAGSARLAELSALEALDEPPLPPGFPDVAAALAGELARRGTLPLSIAVRLAAPRGVFAPVVVALLDGLRAAGAGVEDHPADAPAAPAGTDLGALQRALLDRAAARAALSGDGSLLLLEADTPVEAAELAASALRGADAAATTVVAAAEVDALDAALARQGVATLGLPTSARLRPALQFLPLRLGLAFAPRDPLHAAELLLLPGAPLPAHARRALLDALNEMPGVGSPAWREAKVRATARELERAAARGAPDGDARAAGDRLAAAIETWFEGEPFDPREGIPAAVAAGLCGRVAAWARSRAGGGAADPSPWAHAAAVAATLERILLARPPGERLAQLALAQLHELALGDGSPRAAHRAEAGRPAVAPSPPAVLPGAATVLWFGFGDVGAAAAAPWTDPERDALAAAGVAVDRPGALRRLEAWGWRRPILAARERAILVRWRLDGTDPVAPHPLLDELAARTAAGALATCTVGSERLLAGAASPFGAAIRTVAPAAPLAPRAVWKVAAAALAPEGSLSATALDVLLGCPFRWALEHPGRLRPGRGVDLPDGRRLQGDLAHRILQDMVLGEERLDPATATDAEAAAWGARAFDARVGIEAAPLARPGREVERDAARTLVSNAAASLMRHLRDGGWTVTAREREVTGTFAGRPARGFVDLALERDGREALLDLKLSGAFYRRRELEEGRALQLALYAALMRRGGGPHPPAGYLILDDGQLLTTSPGAFPGATVVDGPSAAETLRGAEEGFAYWQRAFARGVLPILAEDLDWAAGVEAAAGPLPPEDGPARREPPCQFCRFDTICHAVLGREVTR